MSRKSPRIEPTLFGNGEPQEHITAEQAQLENSSETNAEQTSRLVQVKKLLWQYVEKFDQLYRQHILASRRNTLIARAVLFAICLIAFSSVLVSRMASNSEQPQLAVTPAPKPQQLDLTARLHQVSFPDNFSLATSQYNGMVVGWQADTIASSKLWDIARAEGEQSCQQITFNNGDSYRTLTVVVEQGTRYFANFSPLDSAAIVNAIAMRGSFKLCGYQFSLKGSQAVLGKHPYYGELVNY